MAQRTRSSEPVGPSKSSAAKSPAPAAASSSPRARRGTSTTPTTAPTIAGPPTAGATGRPRRTKPPAGAGSQSKAGARGTGKALERKRPELSIDLVAEAVLRDFRAMFELAPELASSGLAAAALSLARSVDDPDSTTSKAACARAMTEALKELRSLLPDKPEGDGLDDLAAKRAARLAGQSAASPMARAEVDEHNGPGGDRAVRPRRAVPRPVAALDADPKPRRAPGRQVGSAAGGSGGQPAKRQGRPARGS